MSATQENFRLVGIRPHTDCSTKFAKVLTKGRLYKFYEEFEFYKSEDETAGDGDAILFYKRNVSAVPQDLYKVNNLNVNISAVVGKNGSGKSTLIELILYSIYKLGTSFNEKGKTVLRPFFEEIVDKLEENQARIKAYETRTTDLKSSIIKLSDAEDLSTIKKNTIPEIEKKVSALLKFDHKIKDLIAEKNKFKRQSAESIEEHKFIHNELKCSLYFEINGVLFEYSTTEGFKQPQELDGLDKTEPDAVVRNLRSHILTDSLSSGILYSFFYSIVLNYSHYGLNSNSLGYWITTLFHKNDGYRTPAVINPMRTEGIIDVNNENELAKARLLSNLLVEAFYARSTRNKIKLTDKQYVCKVRFTLDNAKKTVKKIKLGDISSHDKEEKFVISGPLNMLNIIQEILPLYFDNSRDLTDLNGYKKLPFADDVLNYLALKVSKVVKKYRQYDSVKKHDSYFSYIREVLSGLKGDKSHVIFKIERALFYLRKLKDKQGHAIWNKFSRNDFAEFDLFELLDWMEIKKETDLHLILERIPPSIFTIDFILDSHADVEDRSREDSENLPKFSGLSSGEQQKIHIINGVVYHLNNIYSIHNSNPDANRIKYHYVNVVFDEIELYFHPDLQKEFIYDLVANIKRLVYINSDTERRIKGLNFIFATHSPFILSDIPVQNIVKLQFDEVLKTSVQLEHGRQTFAANIHDLLANNFFFRDKIFIGNLADHYLKELIKRITGLKERGEHLSYEESLVLQRKAFLIGERFFREKLLEMIREQSDVTKEQQIEMLLVQKRKEIEELEKEKLKESNDTDNPSESE